MPQIRCPNCKNIFTATEESRGSRLACPSCDTPCRIPLKKGASQAPVGEQAIAGGLPPASSPMEEDMLEEVLDVAEAGDDEEIELEVVGKLGRKKKKRSIRTRDGNMDFVNWGLGCYYAAVLALMAGIVVELAAIGAGATAGLSAFAGSAEGVAGGLGFAHGLGFLAGLMINWLAPILGLTASSLCLWAPAASGARVFCLVAVALNAGAMLAGLMQAGLSFLPGTDLIALFLLLLAITATFVAWCMFMWFLRRLCVYLGEPALESEAVGVMMRGVAILIVTPFAFAGAICVVAAFAKIPVVNLMFMVLMCLAMGAVLFVFLRRQLDLIGSMRQVIASRF
ncbi:MAG TPA: hypothetical protein VMS17_08385 [Gemmataceae bacterium]|nr:hypothetical protein [Gemmataceae bacterium]